MPRAARKPSKRSPTPAEGQLRRRRPHQHRRRAAPRGEVGEIDILINNAGISRWGPTAEFDVATFDAMFASNVRAPFFLVAALAPGMAARGHGSIVSLSSMAGGVGLVGGAAYGATKASLEAMTRAWAAEYSASGVRINAIAPGPVYTPTPSGPSSSRHSEKPRRCAAPHNPRRSPRSSHSSPPHERATSPAPRSPPTAAAEQSNHAAIGQNPIKGTSHQMIDHVTLRVPDLVAATSAFKAVLDELGIEQTTNTPSFSAWGNFALTQTDDEHPIARRVHVAFIAPTQPHVERFGQAGINAGFADDGAAGLDRTTPTTTTRRFSKTAPATASKLCTAAATDPRATSITSPSASKTSRRQLRSTRRSALPPVSRPGVEALTAPRSPSEHRAAPSS